MALGAYRHAAASEALHSVCKSDWLAHTRRVIRIGQSQLCGQHFRREGEGQRPRAIEGSDVSNNIAQGGPIESRTA